MDGITFEEFEEFNNAEVRDMEQVVETSEDGDEEHREVAENPPSFPMLILLTALVKDVSDAGSLGFLGFISAPIAWFIIWIWMMTKPRVVRKYVWKRRLKRYALSAPLEMIPGIDLIPLTTMLVIRVHETEMRFSRMLNLKFSKKR